MSTLHPIRRRLLSEELVRHRRADERRRYAVSQRRGRIDPNPHQIDAVVFALRRIPEGGCILADEVGLGKTIEAGLIISQLLAEGMRRVLIIVPKSLLGQWQAELFDLFGIEAREGQANPQAFEGDGVFLVHREFAGGVKGASLLASADDFDLAVIDEAQEIFAGIYKRFNQQGEYDSDSDHAQIADRVRSFLKPRSTPVLLLTATPIQNSLTELWGLIQYVEPTNTLFGKLPTFRELFCENGDRSLRKEQAFELKRRLAVVMQRTLRRQAQEFLDRPFVERQARLINFTMSPEERSLYEDVTAWLTDPKIVAFRGQSSRLLVLAFHRRLASSLAALRSSLEKVAYRLKRQIADEDPEWDGLAKELTGELEEDEDLSDDAPIEHLTRDRLVEELNRVENFCRRALTIGIDGKAHGLLQTLQVIRERGDRGDGTGKVVIFTEAIATQDFLYEYLTANGFAPGEVTLFRGQNQSPRALEALAQFLADSKAPSPEITQTSPSTAMRLALIHEFKTRSRVFISTEAGAKGLNLQFCETIINFDLPWNPQRIEQRIGRVHRYGQQRGVTVLNFVDLGNEGQVLTFEILSQKLDLFGQVLDSSDAILYTPRTDVPESIISGLGLEFEKEIRKIYQQSRSIDEIAGKLRGLRETMETLRQDYDSRQSAAAAAIETKIDRTIRPVFRKYKDELPEGLQELDRDLDALAKGYLEAIGAKFHREPNTNAITYQVDPCNRLPPSLSKGATFVVGRADNNSTVKSLHPGHDLIIAAVSEARTATNSVLTVKFLPTEGSLPALLVPLAGQRGKLFVTKVAHRGFERLDQIITVALLEGATDPLPSETVDELILLEPNDVLMTDRPVVDIAILEDAVEEALLTDLSLTTADDGTRFNRKLEQLDHFLQDQILVLRRRKSALERRLQDSERKKEKAGLPSVSAREGFSIRNTQAEIDKIEARLTELEAGRDPEYQRWREQLHERRYRRPTLERLLDVDFQIGEGVFPC